jgi:hypothetical protein
MFIDAAYDVPDKAETDEGDQYGLERDVVQDGFNETHVEGRDEWTQGRGWTER